MTKDDIIRMAREAGLWETRHSVEMAIGGVGELERFAALVASAECERVQKVYEDAAKDSVKAAIKQEREACAKLCEEIDLPRTADLIRARGQA